MSSVRAGLPSALLSRPGAAHSTQKLSPTPQVSPDGEMHGFPVNITISFCVHQIGTKDAKSLIQKKIEPARCGGTYL